MEQLGHYPSAYGIEKHGFENLNRVYWNLGRSELVEQAIQREEGKLAANGALLVTTGKRTGRSPKDRFIVKESPTDQNIDWGNVNVPVTSEVFDQLFGKVMAYFQGRDVFVQDCFGGADPNRQMPIRVVNEYAWHNLFARTLFVRPKVGSTTNHTPKFTIISAPGFHPNPAVDGVHSDGCVIISFSKGIVLLAGMRYGGESKKSIFGILNYLLPQEGILPMHCSANVGEEGDTALFFGLSGTGKTTLSADPNRRLIGDDEHGWGDEGVFNFEGGCYAKCIRLSHEAEPQIWNAIRFGSVLENVVVDPVTRVPDYDDGSLTENTRVTYPVEFIDNAVIPGIGGHPQNVLFLSCDAFGVLPPISRLSPDQAMYHFLSGYTAKVAGTEAGVTEPQASFSACFGAPFLPLHPTKYAHMLGEKLEKHNATVWLVNTGWSGGPHGVGKRMKIAYTRALVTAALSGSLSGVEFRKDPVFGVEVPTSCPGVPSEVLNPRGTWADPQAYDAKAKDLAGRFNKNFEKYASQASDAVKAAAPKS